MSDAAFYVLAAGLAAATVIDLRSRRIPNVLTGSMAALGVGLAAAGANGPSIGASLLGIVIGLVVMMPGYALGATGAGDVKLMGAVGAIVGPALIIPAFLGTSVAGGVLAVVVATRRKRLGATLVKTGQFVTAPGGATEQIRSATSVSRFAYGPAIAVGTILAVLMRT